MQNAGGSSGANQVRQYVSSVIVGEWEHAARTDALIVSRWMSPCLHSLPAKAQTRFLCSDCGDSLDDEWKAV